jgi:class 3 adenylate cyclase
MVPRLASPPRGPRRCPTPSVTADLGWAQDMGMHATPGQSANGDGPSPRSDAVERYLILMDISGYTGFLAGVERQHGEDFSAGLPAGYRVLGELLQDLIDGLAPEFELVKVEGDAVFGTGQAEALDGRGAALVSRLGALYRTFTSRRDVMAVTATDDKCTACFAVATLDLKIVIHRGFAVRQPIGGSLDLVGPAVNVAHRLLKNTVRDRIGQRPYLLITDAAADKLQVADRGLDHDEHYPDVGSIGVRIVDLAEAAGVRMTTWVDPIPGSEDWPKIQIGSA